MLVLSFNAFAETNTTSTSDSTPIFSREEVVGNNAQSTKELFSPTQPQNISANTPVISDVNLSYEDGLLNFSAIFSYNGEELSINTSGEMYKNEQTENAGVTESLILVDMQDIGDWHFVQFRIDRNNKRILVILQNTSNYELVQFLVDITENDFNMFYDLHKNSISGEQLENKIIELYSVGRNVLNREVSTTSHYEGDFPPAQSSQNQVAEAQATYKSWVDLMDDLKRMKTVDASAYSNIDLGMLAGGDWQFDDNFSSEEKPPYSLVSFSYENGPSEYLAQFSLAYLVTQFDVDSSEADWRVDASLEYKFTGGMIVSYNTITDEITLVHRDAPISIENLEVGLGELSVDDAFFINRIISGSCQYSGASPIQAAIAYVPYASDISDLWSSMSLYEPVDLDDITTFPTDLEGQLNTNGGELVRGIAATIGNGIMAKNGHHLLIKGTMLISPEETEISWWHKYKYSCYTNI